MSDPSAIAAAVKKMKVAELKTQLENRGLNSTGLKQVLIDRLEQALISEARSTDPLDSETQSTSAMDSNPDGTGVVDSIQPESVENSQEPPPVSDAPIEAESDIAATQSLEMSELVPDAEKETENQDKEEQNFEEPPVTSATEEVPLGSAVQTESHYGTEAVEETAPETAAQEAADPDLTESISESRVDVVEEAPEESRVEESHGEEAVKPSEEDHPEHQEADVSVEKSADEAEKPKKPEGPHPGRGCEVFVGRIPRDVTESELRELFGKVGPIYEVRLLMDVQGLNRGFGFVVFQSKEHAERAIKHLDHYQIRDNPPKRIGVCVSDDNNRLFLGNVPRDMSKEQLREEVCRKTDGLVDVILYPDPENLHKNRGFAFLEYESHQVAANARKKLMSLHLASRLVHVDWAEPVYQPDDRVMAKVKGCYIRNVPLDRTEDELKEYFSQAGEVTLVKKKTDYAFVHFTERDMALKAIDMFNAVEWHGRALEVVLAKPMPKDRSFDRPRAFAFFRGRSDYDSRSRHDAPRDRRERLPEAPYRDSRRPYSSTTSSYRRDDRPYSPHYSRYDDKYRRPSSSSREYDHARRSTSRDRREPSPPPARSPSYSRGPSSKRYRDDDSAAPDHYAKRSRDDYDGDYGSRRSGSSSRAAGSYEPRGGSYSSSAYRASASTAPYHAHPQRSYDYAPSAHAAYAPPATGSSMGMALGGMAPLGGFGLGLNMPSYSSGPSRPGYY